MVARCCDAKALPLSSRARDFGREGRGRLGVRERSAGAREGGGAQEGKKGRGREGCGLVVSNVEGKCGACQAGQGAAVAGPRCRVRKGRG